MAASTDKYVVVMNKGYFGAQTLGFVAGNFVAEMYTTEDHSEIEYVTLPLSATWFRDPGLMKNPWVMDSGRFIVIADDYGYPHWIEAERAVLDTLLKQCIENGVPHVAHP